MAAHNISLAIFNWFGSKAGHHNVVSKTGAITVVVELVDGIGITDDDVANGESVFKFAHACILEGKRHRIF